MGSCYGDGLGGDDSGSCTIDSSVTCDRGFMSGHGAHVPATTSPLASHVHVAPSPSSRGTLTVAPSRLRLQGGDPRAERHAECPAGARENIHGEVRRAGAPWVVLPVN